MVVSTKVLSLSITVEEIISLVDGAKLANELLDDCMFDEITWVTVIWAKDKWVLVKYVCCSSEAVDIVDGTDDSESASNDSTRFIIFCISS